MKNKTKNIIAIIISAIIVLGSIFASIFAEDLRNLLSNIPVIKKLLTPPQIIIVGIAFILLIVYQAYCLISNSESEKNNKAKKTKYTHRQKKFMKIAKKEYNDFHNPKNVFKFDVDFIEMLGEYPRIQNLRYFDAETGTTDKIPFNGIFRGMDCNAIRKQIESYLNTEWDSFNKK